MSEVTGGPRGPQTGRADKRTRPMQRSLWRIRQVVVVAFAVGGCSQTKDVSVNAWFQIRTKRPVRQGIFTFGSPSESYRIRSGWGWREIARGSGGGVVRLQRDTAVLFAPGRSEPRRIIYEGEKAAQVIPEFLECDGPITVSPDGAFLDCTRCTTGPSPLACGEGSITRYDVALRTVTMLPLPPAPRGEIYMPPWVLFYDGSDTPYFQTQAPAGDLIGTFCQLSALDPHGVLSWSAPAFSRWGCGGGREAWASRTGRALREPKRGVAFFGSPPDVVPP
jgi:hypothetical protein